MLTPDLKLLTRPVEGADRLISAAALSAGLGYGECVQRLDPELDLINDVRLDPAAISADFDLSVKSITSLFKHVETANGSASVPLGDSIRALSEEWEPQANWNADVDVSASTAIQVERYLLETQMTFETEVALARLVAALTDRAAFLSRQVDFHGFCSELSDIEWDIRHLATGMVRIGTLPKRDPRVLLDDAKYRQYADINVGAELSRLILDAQRQIKRARYLPGSPYSRKALQALNSEFIDKSDFWLESDEGVSCLRILAKVFEGIGMNLHTRGGSSRAVGDTYLVLAGSITREASSIQQDLALSAAGRQPTRSPDMPVFVMQGRSSQD